MVLFVLLAMIFCHIVDDYYLQGWLANAKQKQWWMENAPQEMYKHDYIMALVMHSLSWSFMVMLPIALYFRFDIGGSFIYFFIFNALNHGLTDNLKANAKKINLVQDQLFHLAQIGITYLWFVAHVYGW